MRVLALDSTSASGSVAVVEDGRVLVEQEGDPGLPQAERLPADLLSALHAAGLALADIDRLAVASGPGSFTGLRIGIATMQGLAHVTGRRIVVVSALEAVVRVAARDLAPGRLVGVWQDARRGDVFSALFRVADASPDSPGRLVAVDEAAVEPPAAVSARWRGIGAWPDLLAGDGAVRYGIEFAAGVSVAAHGLLAGAIGRLACAAGTEAALVPAAVHPFYIRRPDAEVLREARDRASTADAPAGPGGVGR